MQVNTASYEPNAKLQPVLNDDTLTKPPRITKTITVFVNHPSEFNTTLTVTWLEKITETASLLISHSMSTIFDKEVAIEWTDTTEWPYSVEENTQITEFSVVTSEQSN